MPWCLHGDNLVFLTTEANLFLELPQLVPGRGYDFIDSQTISRIFFHHTSALGKLCISAPFIFSLTDASCLYSWQTVLPNTIFYPSRNTPAMGGLQTSLSVLSSPSLPFRCPLRLQEKWAISALNLTPIFHYFLAQGSFPGCYCIA